VVTVYFIRANNEKVQVEVSEGTTLMQAAKQANIREIPADCGGSCACATCHIIVEEGWDHLEPADDDEIGLLDMEPNSNERSRLSCQIDVDDLPKDAILKIKVPHCD